MKKNNTPTATIARNKKAMHDYTLEKTFEAGIALAGWEVKSLRAGHIQLKESYLLLKKGEAWLFGAHIKPLPTTATHIHADPTRTRKLLLKRKELNQLIGAVQRKGYTAIPLDLHWKRKYVKVAIALGKGKKTHDKRATEKARDWTREKQRILKNH